MVIQIHFRTATSWLNTEDYPIQDQEQLYEQQLQDIIDNARYYLDNLHYMREYRLVWTNYKQTKVTKPYRFIKNPQLLPKKRV